MAKPILMDTDVMVDFLRGHPKAVAVVQANPDRIILSSIVVAELYAGVRGNDEPATADSENAELKTLNTKHYPMFKGLIPPYTRV